MKNTIYYDNPDFKIGNHEYHTYFCEGMRGRGKSTYWLYTLARRAYIDAIEHGKKATHRFVYLRRTDVELQKVLSLGLFNAVFDVHPEFRDEVGGKCDFFQGKLYFGKTCIGYYLTLNKVKSISLEDCDALLFDEIVAQNRADYKGGEGGMNEPGILARLDDTLFRGRENWHIYLGNRDTPTNPYTENWHVPYGVSKWKDKKRGLWYEFDATDAARQKRAETATGARWAGTSYDDYATGRNALGEIASDLIVPRPKDTYCIYNIKIGGERLTIWRRENSPIKYVVDNCLFDTTLPIYCAFNMDMSVNSMFIQYATGFIPYLKQNFAFSNFRFNSQKTFALFSQLLSLN